MVVMAAPAPAPPDPVGQPRRSEQRAFWRAAIIMSGAIVVLIVLFVIFYPSPGKGLSHQEQLELSRTRAPQIIPTPADRNVVTQPGDPGGWEQVMLLGVLLAGLAVVAFLAWRSMRKAKPRAGRAGPPRTAG
jgi:hypothetical protein